VLIPLPELESCWNKSGSTASALESGTGVKLALEVGARVEPTLEVGTRVEPTLEVGVGAKAMA
jgi:hypothetical protein